MKAALLHIILFLYTASVLKPVLPVMVDVFAHTFQELEHTSTVHMHQGEEHVHVQVAELATSGTDDEPAAKIDCSVTPHVPAQLELHIGPAPLTQQKWGSASQPLTARDPSVPHRPPKH